MKTSTIKPEKTSAWAKYRKERDAKSVSEEKPALPFTKTECWHAGRDGYEQVTVTALADGGIFVGEKEYWTLSTIWGRRRLRASCLFPKNKKNDAVVKQCQEIRCNIEALETTEGLLKKTLIPFGGAK